jgi:hypothetical protein
MKASNRNMLYMCESRCILGPWEGGLRLDKQPLNELYELTVPHWKSVLFEHEVLQVAYIPEEAVRRAKLERAAKEATPPPAVAAALAAQAAAAQARANGKRRRI